MGHRCAVEVTRVRSARRVVFRSLMAVFGAVFLLCSVCCLRCAFAAVAPGEADEPTGHAEARFVPVSVHLLRVAHGAAGTSLKRADIDRIFRKVNQVWHPAAIYLWVESVVEETPADSAGSESSDELTLNLLPSLRPPASLAQEMFHVYYIHAMPPNGIFMGDAGIFVKETARLRPVPGGIDEPLPRVTSHELGHAMGLPHRQDTTNLMASGTTGISLNEAEIETVRSTVSALSWTASATAFRKQADALARSGNRSAAARRYRALEEYRKLSRAAR